MNVSADNIHAATHALESLTVINYLAEPSKEVLQTLLLIGNVLQNDMKPQAAWALGGTTIRLAQCLGIQRKTMPNKPLPSAVTPLEAAKLRYVAAVFLVTFAPPTCLSGPTN